MRRKGASEKYVRVIQDMYEGSRTRVRSSVGATEEFCVRVGLHQGSSLSPYLFNLLMDDSIQNIKEEAPWTMLFADDIVLVDESRDGVERKLERWRRALEERADGNLDGEIIHRIQSGWKNWKRTTGVLCDRKISARDKPHSSVIKALQCFFTNCIQPRYLHCHVGELGPEPPLTLPSLPRSHTSFYWTLLTFEEPHMHDLEA
ncbi:uncharacterized protein LOC123516705 [Portunus trituberculatus]|uniref:uncharacterized protein LOC123516705 n=1 Tax=Portunus trituberculatus TaxID=210409 RepID=UPI001E1CD5F2|nr:uncharacterized protein LOC123516705 [Portunus trituberculatus]